MLQESSLQHQTYEKMHRLIHFNSNIRVSFRICPTVVHTSSTVVNKCTSYVQKINIFLVHQPIIFRAYPMFVSLMLNVILESLDFLAKFHVKYLMVKHYKISVLNKEDPFDKQLLSFICLIGAKKMFISGVISITK